MLVCSLARTQLWYEYIGAVSTSMVCVVLLFVHGWIRVENTNFTIPVHWRRRRRDTIGMTKKSSRFLFHYSSSIVVSAMIILPVSIYSYLISLLLSCPLQFDRYSKIGSTQSTRGLIRLFVATLVMKWWEGNIINNNSNNSSNNNNHHVWSIPALYAGCPVF